MRNLTFIFAFVLLTISFSIQASNENRCQQLMESILSDRAVHPWDYSYIQGRLVADYYKYIQNEIKKYPQLLEAPTFLQRKVFNGRYQKKMIPQLKSNIRLMQVQLQRLGVRKPALLFMDASGLSIFERGSLIATEERETLVPFYTGDLAEQVERMIQDHPLNNTLIVVDMDKIDGSGFLYDQSNILVHLPLERVEFIFPFQVGLGRGENHKNFEAYSSFNRDFFLMTRYLSTIPAN